MEQCPPSHIAVQKSGANLFDKDLLARLRAAKVTIDITDEYITVDLPSDDYDFRDCVTDARWDNAFAQFVVPIKQANTIAEYFTKRLQMLERRQFYMANAQSYEMYADNMTNVVDSFNEQRKSRDKSAANKVIHALIFKKKKSAAHLEELFAYDDTVDGALAMETCKQLAVVTEYKVKFYRVSDKDHRRLKMIPHQLEEVFKTLKGTAPDKTAERQELRKQIRKLQEEFNTANDHAELLNP